MPSTELKIVFAGTPQFAAIALQKLLDTNHNVIAVYTQPDKPSGRGLKLTASPVKTLALTAKLPLFQPVSLKDTDAQSVLADLKADVMVVAAYGLLLPAAILNIPRLGCINIHPSLLPRWRGAAPIQRTIFSGDSKTGVTIMQMDQGLDTGPMLYQCECKMATNETAASLHDKLAHLGADALIETLTLLAQDKIKPHIQDNALATYAHKISKEEALIDWMRPAVELEREIRAFNPWPVAHTSWQGQNLRIWQATAISYHGNAHPRTILHASQEGIDIATGDGALRLLEIQQAGSKRLAIADFYNAKHHELQIGSSFL